MIRILVALMLLGSASAQLAAAPACVADKCTKSSNADADCCNDDAIATAAGCAAGHTLYDPTSAGGYNNQNECTGTGDFAAVTLGTCCIENTVYAACAWGDSAKCTSKDAAGTGTDCICGHGDWCTCSEGDAYLTGAKVTSDGKEYDYYTCCTSVPAGLTGSAMTTSTAVAWSIMAVAGVASQLLL